MQAMTMNEMVVAPVKSLLRPRNTFFDELFYDVGCLTNTELRELRLAPDREGSVIVVSPSAKQASIRHYPTAKAMLAQARKSMVGVDVAGVGAVPS